MSTTPLSPETLRWWREHERRRHMARSLRTRFRLWLVNNPITNAVLWNAVIKVNRKRWGSPASRSGKPYLNGRPTTDTGFDPAAIYSVFGWGWFSGYLSEPTGNRPGVWRRVMRAGRPARARRWGRVELRGV